MTAEELLAKHPTVFGSPPTVYLECGDGWIPLLDALASTIAWELQGIEDQRKANIKYNAMREGLLNDDMTLFNEAFGHPAPHADWVEGWIEVACRQPAREIPEPTEFRVAQVKEKFGTLRFYVYGGNDAIQGMIRLAETMSARTCELCGDPGESTYQKVGGWIQTLCPDHMEERVNKMKETK